MPTKGRVEISKCSDCAPAERKVSEVYVVKATGARAKVKCGAGEDTIDKIPLEVWVPFEKGAQVVDVVGVKVGGPGSENAYRMILVF